MYYCEHINVGLFQVYGIQELTQNLQQCLKLEINASQLLFAFRINYIRVYGNSISAIIYEICTEHYPVTLKQAVFNNQQLYN